MNQLFGLAVIGDEELLIALTPGQVGVVQLYAEPGFEEVKKLQQAHAVLNAAADRYLFPIAGDWFNPRVAPA